MGKPSSPHGVSVVPLARAHPVIYVILAIMGAVIGTLAVRGAPPLGIAIPSVIFLGPLVSIALYRTDALLDSAARTVTIRRSFVLSWRGPTLPVDRGVRVEQRLAYSSHSSDGGRRIGDVLIGSRVIVSSPPRRAEAIKTSIESFFAAHS